MIRIKYFPGVVDPSKLNCYVFYRIVHVMSFAQSVQLNLPLMYGVQMIRPDMSQQQI